MKRMMFVLGCVAIGALFCGQAPAQDLKDFPASPFTDQLPLTEEDFQDAKTYTADDRIVGTYYFYWYDHENGEHFVWPDGRDYQTDHPLNEVGYSYKNPAWHRREMEDVLDAGIDFITPVYWGCPQCSAFKWSFEGLPPLVQACDEMLSESLTPPRIGLFYDTSTLSSNDRIGTIDLTTDFGREWFYASIRDFFANIPPRYWAMIDGKPIVILYAAFAPHDQTCIDYAKRRFAEDFAGREPYIVREKSWNVKSDNIYAWGAAVDGFVPFGVMGVGPGYDHRGVVPPRDPFVVYREGGTFYERNWMRALMYPSNIVMVETWNELHEGTDICATKEFGRQYIELTAKYAKLFHEGKQLELPPGPFAGAESVSIVMGREDIPKGLKNVQVSDGATEPAEIGGKSCRKSVVTKHGPAYLYFAVDDSYLFLDTTDVEVDIEFYDHTAGMFTIQYDSADPNAFMGGSYATCPDSVTMTGSGVWRTETLRLPGVLFGNRQNSSCDLRIHTAVSDLHVRSMTVRRTGGDEK